MAALIFLTHPPEAFAKYYGDKAFTRLQALATVRRNPLDRELTTSELAEAAAGCGVIVSYRQTPGEANLFSFSPDLAAFVRCAVDIRNVDVEAASREGILVTQASRGFVPAVAELIVGYMVDLARGVSAATEAYHAGRAPEAVVGRQLRGATLGIIGYGAIGRYLARLGLALGMTIVIADPYATVEDPRLRQLDQDTLLGEADFVVCLAVANEETESLIDAAALSRMKRSAFLINPGRGNLVDEAALARALDEAHIAGAAMDVGRAPDQMPSPELTRRRNVIATPHIGGLTPEAIEHQAFETVRQVETILQGQIPAGAVNADAATRVQALAKKRPIGTG